MLEKARLYLHTLRHLRLSQVLWRAWYTARRNLGLYRIPRGGTAPGFDRTCLRRLREFLQACGGHGMHAGTDMEALRNQAFCFLNRPMENTGRIPWRDTAYPKLWRYQLNGFLFAREFAVNAVTENYLGDRDRARNWMFDWIRENPPGNDASWDAGPVSDRLLNWTLLIAALDIQDEEIRASYFRQACWLKGWVEYDLRANHLLKNACALTLAAEVFDNEYLRKRGLRLLHSQVGEQILSDGAHFERSPMYHAQALWDLLIVHAALEDTPSFLGQTLRNMTGFLDTIRHPDGEIPLFGDSVLRQAPETEALLRIATERVHVTKATDPSGQAGDALSPSGFYVMRNKDRGDHMIVKTAPPLPRFQPGHSHADIFSYELSLRGLRFIVDSGVHGYAESPLRTYCRSTQAHNIAQLDHLEQSEMWSVFRIARSPLTGPVLFQADETTASLEAHYIHPRGPVHRRHFAYDRETSCWKIHDLIETTGTQHVVKSYIHFHPQCQVHLEGNEIVARRESAGARIELLSPGTMELRLPHAPTLSHWYCPEFGLSHPCTTVILQRSGGTTLDISYKIRPTESAEC